MKKFGCFIFPNSKNDIFLEIGTEEINLLGELSKDISKLK